jgi:hypothetical protein
MKLAFNVDHKFLLDEVNNQCRSTNIEWGGGGRDENT